ncbi:MAG: ATP synthase F1 subunit epsilon [Candidatus Eisenbacteria bacterium]|nr:ATP synthase F1 subunit epsilon [Candidatus Eisenbacteria bacterium]
MSNLFKLSILTPEKVVFEGDVQYVHAPGTEGYFGVLVNHAAMVTALATGKLTVRNANGAEEHWQVSGGFFEVSDNSATVLADAVETAKN